ncbi:hypothetical protein BpHYR1_009694 [Brachionus plicatilis]|uniref:Uncharacterized protein n=1 Tax=Brachionus plicatilis TaxID=10195 RepID=A0A3M7QZJ5_BRAPC|nr:hypothetical protein BpHYR1_009694 [Brachionus plicatilis]
MLKKGKITRKSDDEIDDDDDSDTTDSDEEATAPLLRMGTALEIAEIDDVVTQKGNNILGRIKVTFIDPIFLGLKSRLGYAMT